MNADYTCIMTGKPISSSEWSSGELNDVGKVPKIMHGSWKFLNCFLMLSPQN